MTGPRAGAAPGPDASAPSDVSIPSGIPPDVAAPVSAPPDVAAPGQAAQLPAGGRSRLRAVLDRLLPLTDATGIEEVERLTERLAANRLRVLLVGEAKRGKSTLGNALLGRPVLPTGVVPVTAITTTIRHGRPERVEAALPAGTRTLPLDRLADLVTEERNPGNRRGVREVSVYLDGGASDPGDGWLDTVELVDTPGVGSVHDHNTAEADAALAAMDAAVFVLTADPPVSASERALLRRVRELSVRTVVVLNKADRLAADEREEVLGFTSRAIRDDGGGAHPAPPILVCSAREGLLARRCADPQRWRASGLEALTAELTDHVAANRDRDLVASLAGSARRLLRRLLDETRLQLRTAELRAARKESDLEAFRQVVRGLERSAKEARAVASADLARLRGALDDTTAARREALTATALQRLDEALDDGARLPTAAVEDAAHTAVVEAIRPAVEGWRRDTAEQLGGGLRDVAARQQELLDTALAGIRATAREHLGIDLYAESAPVELPDSGAFFYTFEAPVGWGHLEASALRRHLPAAVGHRRVRARSRAEAIRLVDVHLGRARGDFQTRLTEAGRGLTRTVDRSYREQRERLSRALAGPRDPDTPRELEAARTRLATLHDLAEDLEALIRAGG